jgi:hypothetical protein
LDQVRTLSYYLSNFRLKSFGGLGLCWVKVVVISEVIKFLIVFVYLDNERFHLFSFPSSFPSPSPSPIRLTPVAAIPPTFLLPHFHTLFQSSKDALQDHI